MSQWQVNGSAFDEVFRQLNGKVKYGLGSKIPLKTPPQNVPTKCDCSGFVRYMFYHTAGLVFPDGSWIQREWCEKNLALTDYDAALGMKIAFITAGRNGAGSVGHVWFVSNGRTYESYGGYGVGSRAWNYATLKNQVHKTFSVPFFDGTGFGDITYKLIASDGHTMHQLPVFDGRSYVPARKWGSWFKLVVDWQVGKVLFNGIPVASTVKMIKEDGENRAYVPFTEAAAFSNLTYAVNNDKREIRLGR